MLNTMTVALLALRRNATRSLLTILGIVIGIASVICMMEIGNGSALAIKQAVEKMGATSIMIFPGVRRVAGVSMGSSSWISLYPEDAEAIKQCPHITLVSPVVIASNIQIIYGNNNWVPDSIRGVSPEFLQCKGWEIDEGRALTRRDVDGNARVCLLGQTIVRELFGGKSPIGVEMRIGNATFNVVGTLKSKGANMLGGDEDDIILAPWTTVRMRITGVSSGSASSTKSSVASTPGEIYSGSGVALYPEQDSNLSTDRLWKPRFMRISNISAAAATIEDVPIALKEIGMMLRERHQLRPDQDDDFRVNTTLDLMRMISGNSELMTNLLLAVALISLMVGGVGIMNIMLVSVTERTKEIGLRMAVGARSRDILKQFLVESIVLSLIGGVIGIITGHGAALILESQLHWPIASSIGAVIASVAVSAGVGIIFGFYPAWKASKLDPINALRYE